MDIKTLEYMGERVDKARELKGKIDEIEQRILNLRASVYINVVCKCNKESYEWKFSDFFGKEALTSDIIPEFIKLLEARRDSLQHELDEL